MKKFIFLILLTTVIFNSYSQNKQKQNSKTPNVVVIFIDDEGYGDVGAYGATGFKTPHIDQMASQGMRFTNY